MKLFAPLALVVATIASAATPNYQVVEHIQVGGNGGWDLLTVDTVNHRLYVSHGNQTEVIDTATAKKIATIEGTNGAHAIAIANDLGKGFISDGADNQVTIFDLKTLKVLGTAPTGENPDDIIYDPASARVFTFNGRSDDATAIDARTGEVVVASIPLHGKPELSQTDEQGRIWVNVESTNEIIELDARKAAIAKRYSIAPCEEPTDMARDPETGTLYSVCANKLMVVSDPVAGKVLATVPIGAGCDGVVLENGYLFSANGADGTITMVGQTSPGHYEPAATIPTARGARTISADPGAHKLYLPTARISPPGAAKGGAPARPQMVPDSFEILVVAP